MVEDCLHLSLFHFRFLLYVRESDFVRCLLLSLLILRSLTRCSGGSLDNTTIGLHSIPLILDLLRL
jgi:hypothetical protein